MKRNYFNRKLRSRKMKLFYKKFHKILLLFKSLLRVSLKIHCKKEKYLLIKKRKYNCERKNATTSSDIPKIPKAKKKRFRKFLKF